MSSASAATPNSRIRLQTRQALDLIGKLLRGIQEVDISVDDDLNVELRPVDLETHPTRSEPSQEESEALVLLLDTSEVRVEGKPARRVTVQELALLAHLRSRRGAICSKEEVCQVLWPGKTPDRCTAALDKLVSRTRVKIEPDPSRPRFLLTLRGQGYRLVVD
jgi:DNA-binding response OmpR family regulator